MGENQTEQQAFRFVRPDTMADHRRREVRTITGVIAAVKAVAVVGAVVPWVDNLATAVVFGVLALVVVVLVGRWVARRVRWWFEDRHDARIAEQWRADHAAPVAAADADPVGVAP